MLHFLSLTLYKDLFILLFFFFNPKQLNKVHFCPYYAPEQLKKFCKKFKDVKQNLCEFYVRKKFKDVKQNLMAIDNYGFNVSINHLL